MQLMQSDRQKVIAIDFDNTITTTEAGWLRIMLLMEQLGFHVIVVTYRRPTEWPEDLKFLVDKGYKVYYTSRMAKKGYMKRQGIDVDDTVLSIANERFMPHQIVY